MRRLALASMIAVTAAALTAAPASAQDEQAPVPPSTAPAASESLIPVPAGCPQPLPAHLVFVGELVDQDANTGRFQIRVVRAGSSEGLASGNLIDVRYGIDTKYLDLGNQYLVGAGLDNGLLYSKVRPDEPLFGGDEVVGAAEIDVECPTVEDPVRTLSVTGRSIESGVIQPLSTDRGRLLRAVLVPGAVAVAILVGLATVRWLITGVAKGAASAATISRTRRYRSGDQ